MNMYKRIEGDHKTRKDRMEEVRPGKIKKFTQSLSKALGKKKGKIEDGDK